LSVYLPGSEKYGEKERGKQHQRKLPD